MAGSGRLAPLDAAVALLGQAGPMHFFVILFSGGCSALSVAETLSGGWFMSLDNVRIVLVNTSHPGNIGSAARAMKTMGLSQLVLVEPKAFPAPEAVTLSSGATEYPR